MKTSPFPFWANHITKYIYASLMSGESHFSLRLSLPFKPAWCQISRWPRRAGFGTQRPSYILPNDASRRNTSVIPDKLLWLVIIHGDFGIPACLQMTRLVIWALNPRCVWLIETPEDKHIDMVQSPEDYNPPGHFKTYQNEDLYRCLKGIDVMKRMQTSSQYLFYTL